MKNNLFKLIDKLADNHKLEKNEYLQIINNYDEETASYLAKKATEAKFKYYENKVCCNRKYRYVVNSRCKSNR